MSQSRAKAFFKRLTQLVNQKTAKILRDPESPPELVARIEKNLEARRWSADRKVRVVEERKRSRRKT